MKKIALFLCSMSLVAGVPMAAKESKQKQVAIATEQLTPEIWDKQMFAPLAAEHKIEVVGTIQTIQVCFQKAYDSVDKGVDPFWESLGIIMQMYGQLVKGFLPQGDLCFSVSPIIQELEAKLPMIKALVILPSFKEVFEAATRSLPTNKENMTEQDLKRAMNKPFRNKEAKTELKMLLKKQCDAINSYADYVNKMYAQEVAEFKAQMQAQMQEFLSAMQERQG
jgi:hypothetical protein